MPTVEENERREERAKMLARLDQMYVTVENAVARGELGVKEGVTLLLKIEAQIGAASGVGMYPARLLVLGAF